MRRRVGAVVLAAASASAACAPSVEPEGLPAAEAGSFAADLQPGRGADTSKVEPALRERVASILDAAPALGPLSLPADGSAVTLPVPVGCGPGLGEAWELQVAAEASPAAVAERIGVPAKRLVVPPEGSGRLLIDRITAAQLRRALSDADVEAVSRSSPLAPMGAAPWGDYRLLNEVAGTFHRRAALTGAGETAAVWEFGRVRTGHVELADQRAFPLQPHPFGTPTQLDQHATHVAGTIASGGTAAPLTKGLAPASRLACLTVSDARQLDGTRFDGAVDDGALTINMPLHLSAGWDVDPRDGSWWWWGPRSGAPDPKFGAYTATTRELDARLHDAPRLAVVVAAGNHRADAGPGAAPPWRCVDCPAPGYLGTGKAPPPDGSADRGQKTIDPLATGKNTITVGAIAGAANVTVRDGSAAPTTFSGYGPTVDGRVKPDVAAHGLQLHSLGAGSDTEVRVDTGTSMAAPVVTGVLLQLRQAWRQAGNGDCPGDLLKAMLVHGAWPPSGPPDCARGWGVVDAEASTALASGTPGALVRRLQPAAAGSTWTGRGSAGRAIRVTVVWYDPAAPSDVPPGKALVNDVDVVLERAGGGAAHHPWSLVAGSVPCRAERQGPNRLDTVERIDVSPAEAADADYVLRVTAPPGQPFAIVATGLDDVTGG